MAKRKNRKVNTPKKKNKGGRPRKILSQGQKDLAIQYVLTSGFWRQRLSQYLRIDSKTLDRILEKEKSFSKDLEAADAEFCGRTVRAAKPDFILKTKYREEFPEKVSVEHSMDQKLEEFLDRQSQRLK